MNRVRFWTIVMFLLILLIVAVVYFFNVMIATEYAAEKTYEDCIDDLKERFTIAKQLKESLTIKGLQRNLQKAVSQRNKSRNFQDSIKADSIFAGVIEELVSNEERKELIKEKEINSALNNLILLEDALAPKRRYYNAKASAFNTTGKTFPTNILMQLTGKSELPLFVLTDEEKEGIDPNYRA